MNNKPVLIVSGEPYSVFLEIFFKTKKKKFNRPVILIVSKKLFFKQMQKLNFDVKFGLKTFLSINIELLILSKLNII